VVLSELIRLLGGTRKASERLGISQRTAQRWAKGTQKPGKRNAQTAERLWREVTAEPWSDTEKQLFNDMLRNQPQARRDDNLQDLFDEALFRRGGNRIDRDSAYTELQRVLYEDYGIDFDDVFEWEDYKTWYDAQASAAAA